MKERPADVTDSAVLEVVRRHWAPDVDAVEHLPVGWGGYHWRASVNDAPTLFVTLDPPCARHTPESFEGAYAGAAALGLDFVWPSIQRLRGGYTVAFGERTMSATRWLDGERPTESIPELPAMLDELHAAPVPENAPIFQTTIPPVLAAHLARLLDADWSGPCGADAHELVAAHLDRVTQWSSEHLALIARADPSTYVVTHGEPGVHNQWQAHGRTYLIDWESLLVAPRERDLATLVHEGVATDCDPAMVRLFDLEWWLAEIWSFAQWLQGPHPGDADDRTALGGLTEELTRPHFDES